MTARLRAAGLLALLLACAEEGSGRPAVPEEGRLLVEVLNGSGRRGLARAATRELRRAGFDVVYFGNVSQSVPRTEALARRGDSAGAARVARALGSTIVRVAPDTLLRVDVTVLLGGDYHPPPGLRP
jgi:hypothetical protein